MIDLMSTKSQINFSELLEQKNNAFNEICDCLLIKHCPPSKNFDGSHTTKSIYPSLLQEDVQGQIRKSDNSDHTILEMQKSEIEKNFWFHQWSGKKNYTTFNILIVGKQGSGKTSFVETLLNKKPISNVFKGNCESMNSISESGGMIEFEDQIVNLNLFDSKGFVKNNQKEWLKNITHFINQKFKTHIRTNQFAYLNKTLYSQMQNLKNDERIHVCLYFLSGPQFLKEDIHIIKKLSNKVNVIPILAKGDQYIGQEIFELKSLYSKLFSQDNIDIFDCLQLTNQKFRNELQEGNFGQCSPFMIVTKDSNNIQELKKCECLTQQQNKDLWDKGSSDLILLYKLLVGYCHYDLIKLTDFYQHNFVKRKQEGQKRKNSISGFFTQLILNINQIFYLID